MKKTLLLLSTFIAVPAFSAVQIIALNTSNGSLLTDFGDIDTHTYAQTLFPSASTPEERWSSLLSSDYIVGSANTTTRGIDLIGGTGGFNNLSIYDTTTPNTFYVSPYFAPTNFSESAGLGSIWATEIGTGPYTGTSLLRNPDIVAMDVSRIVLYDSTTDNLYAYTRVDGTLSNSSNLAWTYGDFGNTGTVDNTFTNGPFANQNISSQISNLVGADNQLHFLDGDSTVHVYDQNLDFIATNTITLSGDLAGETFGDLVDGEVDGYTYLGWENGIVVAGLSDPRAVPEPSAYSFILGLLALSFGLTRRQTSHQ
ncbi:MAG: hypothetical protein AAGH40_05810 [Verrucomicrobiota bacterium]